MDLFKLKITMGFMLKLVVFLFFSLSFSAQDSLALISGKSILGELSYQDHQFLYFNKKINENKIKLIRYPLRLVYSLTDQNSKTEVFYHKNPTNGNYLSQDQMKLFVLGEQDALRQFKRGYHFLLGLGFGLTASILDTYEFSNVACKGYFNDSPSIISIATPFLSSVIIGFPNKKVRKAYVSKDHYLESKFYRTGFNRVKNYRKTSSAFIGGLSGVFSVLVVTFVHRKNNPCP